MSTFVIDDSTYEAIHHALTHSYYRGNGTKWQLGLFGINLSVWNEFGVTLDCDQHPEKNNKNNIDYFGIHRFIGVLRANNIRAYNSRYRFDDHEKSEKYRGHHQYMIPAIDPIEPIQLLKSLQCIKYNLDDHQNPALDRLIEAVKNLVIDELPEYQAANWG